jgi:nickel-dependent lactate racemase
LNNRYTHISNYNIYNHNCYENLVEIGKTKRGYPVEINKEFMSCDLKIGLGAILPHVFNTFGGGGKILFPGIASINTVESNHHAATDFQKKYNIVGAQAMGDLRVDGMRSEVEEMTRMVGEFFKVDCLYNSWAKIVDVYAGDALEEYYAAMPAAKKLYVSRPSRDKDIVIVNANARANEATIAVQLANLGISRERGGDLVVIDHTSMGQVIHYLLGRFGDNAPGRLHNYSPVHRPYLRRIICYVPWRDSVGESMFGEKEKQIWVKSWDEVMKLLRGKYGPGTKVSVLVDGTMQYFELDPNPPYAKFFEETKKSRPG